MHSLEDPALVLSPLAHLKFRNSLLVKATGGAVGEIYVFTRRLCWLLTGAEHSSPSLQPHFCHCPDQQGLRSGQGGRGESPFPRESCPLQSLAPFLLWSGAPSPLGTLRPVMLTSSTENGSGTNGNNPQICPNYQKFLGELTSQLSTQGELSNSRAGAVIPYEICSVGSSS